MLELILFLAICFFAYKYVEYEQGTRRIESKTAKK